MNPKLMAMLRAKKSSGAMLDEPEAIDAPAEEMGEPKNTHAYHMKQLGLHLEKGLRGTKRGIKISLKLAKHHHDAAMNLKH